MGTWRWGAQRRAESEVFCQFSKLPPGVVETGKIEFDRTAVELRRSDRSLQQCVHGRTADDVNGKELVA
jgi:hypothetical protein